MENRPGEAERLLPRRLKQLRRERGLTQEGFAEQCGFSYKYYQKIERGQSRNLRLRTLEKLAAGFGVTLAELFSGMER